MRPLRFLLLLLFFVALPIALTCWSLLSASDDAAHSFGTGYNPPSSRLRALFSFTTPSSLFPPSAVISLTNDNSTFFLARPAAFGPGLPSKGMSGELWVGRGFGDDALLREPNLQVAGWELGCSDVPGWGEDESQRTQNRATMDSHSIPLKRRRDVDREGRDTDDPRPDGGSLDDDGTDDYLHHPLPDSNPATPGKPGEPANIDKTDKTKQKTHADIESLQESADIAGKIVMLSRGGCGFLEKVKWAQRRGGIALIVGDNEKGAPLTIMYAKGDTSNVTIPALFTSYTSAHLLSSLVPPESDEDKAGDSTGPDKGPQERPPVKGPVFTPTKSSLTRPTSTTLASSSGERNWVKNVLSKMGLGHNSPFSHSEDSRRPPSSGNIDWVWQEDWDDGGVHKGMMNGGKEAVSPTTTTAAAVKAKSTPSRRPGGDDFVIGVQDWRDSDLVAPKPATNPARAGSPARSGDTARSASSAKTTSGPQATLKGGSITPGSGEYDHAANDQRHPPHGGADAEVHRAPNADHSGQPASAGSWLDLFRSSDAAQDEVQRPAAGSEQSGPGRDGRPPRSSPPSDGSGQLGLWVTLTPTSVSTSPFFDTLLVLVVSPLITLTVVYTLLLLRSRLRRRRWRAPKSVVDRLPVRTYHTMSTASSTTSSQVATPASSSPTSPLLMSPAQNVSQRSRPRSQTATAIFAGSSGDSSVSSTRSPPAEKQTSKFTRRKRYTGRQVECVVCLEEYVDGESRVMSLPCGHEFHVECITPWLVTRRRTCPICKGDVVRSMARGNAARHGEDGPDEDGTSDDFSSRLTPITPDEPSTAIPVPGLGHESGAPVHDDEDVERGRHEEGPLLGDDDVVGQHERERRRQSVWRNIVSASVSRLSGDTLWRQTPVDRNR